MAVRFCEYSECKQPMQEGYVLYDTHTYCCEEHLRKDNPENEDIEGVSTEEMYEKDVAYWTDWYSVEPKLNILKVYSFYDQLYLHEADALLLKRLNGLREPITEKWILISDEEETALTRPLNGFSFNHPEARTFDTLEQVREAYEWEEENCNS